MLVVTAALFSGVWRGGIFEVIPIGARTPTGEERPASSSVVVTGDATLAAWLIPRNAYTLMHSPSRLFEGEHCAPAARTIAFGEPMITLGVLAIPYLLLTGDPIAAKLPYPYTGFVAATHEPYVVLETMGYALGALKQD